MRLTTFTWTMQWTNRFKIVHWTSFICDSQLPTIAWSLPFFEVFVSCCDALGLVFFFLRLFEACPSVLNDHIYFNCCTSMICALFHETRNFLAQLWLANIVKHKKASSAKLSSVRVSVKLVLLTLRSKRELIISCHDVVHIKTRFLFHLTLFVFCMTFENL